MTANRVFRLRDGGVGVEQLRFPRTRLEGDVDPTGYRLRARGELPSMPNREFIPVDAVRGLILDDDAGDSLGALGTTAHLFFVVSGWLELTGSHASPTRFGRGSLLLVETPAEVGSVISHGGGTRLVVLSLAGEWPQEGEPLTQDGGAEAPPSRPNVLAMRQAADGMSYFTEFNQLFAADASAHSDARPAHGVYFAEARDGTFIDMHPEVQSNLVLVLTGALELEVSGSSAIEQFRAGDIALASDRTGEGHIDRFHGTTTLLAAAMVENDPWPEA
jgi:hypothetical protein